MALQALRAKGIRPAASSRRSAVTVKATARVDKCKKTDIIVSPSILSADFAKLGEEVRALCHPALFVGQALDSARCSRSGFDAAGARH